VRVTLDFSTGAASTSVTLVSDVPHDLALSRLAVAIVQMEAAGAQPRRERPARRPRRATQACALTLPSYRK